LIQISCNPRGIIFFYLPVKVVVWQISTVPQMARYFFPIKGDSLSIDDAHGQTFSTLAEARAHAIIIAIELAQDGGLDKGCFVCVIDESGKEMARMAIGDPT
jgi:hypothetical protein